jgi:BA14K-like protein
VQLPLAVEPTRRSVVLDVQRSPAPGTAMIDNRILGAVAIAFAGAVFGFATGRFSAWLVPPSGPASLSSTAKPSVPVAPTAVAKQADRPSKPLESTSSITGVVLDVQKAADRAHLPKPADLPAEPKQAAAPDVAKIEPQVTSRALSPGESPGDASRQDARVINAGSADRPEPQEQIAGGDLRTLTASPDALELCRRKFRSFDPADGTYKPFGQDTRVPCPHLR